MNEVFGQTKVDCGHANEGNRHSNEGNEHTNEGNERMCVAFGQTQVACKLMSKGIKLMNGAC